MKGIICNQNKVLYWPMGAQRLHSGDCFYTSLFRESVILNVTLDDGDLKSDAKKEGLTKC